MELPGDALDIYKQEEIAKFLATVDVRGKVNVVLIISQLPGEPGKLVFGEFMMWKTRDNLEANSRVASMAMTKSLESVEVVADFEGFTDTGPYLDKVNSISMFRYNAYAGIRRVGFLDIKKVYPGIKELKEVGKIAPSRYALKDIYEMQAEIMASAFHTPTGLAPKIVEAIKI